MAKQKPLVRFYARLSTFNAELFSVRERTGGDLMIKHRPIFYERAPFAYFDQDPVITEYYSVHLSPNSTGHVITHTKEMKVDGERRTSWFVECGEGQPLLTLLYSRRHTSLIEQLFKCPINTRDTRVRVAEFDVGKSSLVTHVFVGTRDGIDLGALGLPWDVVTHRFRRFEIHVVRGFFPYPSLEMGCHREPADRSVTKSLRPKDVLTQIDEMNDLLGTTFLPRAFTEFMNANGAELDKVPVGTVLDGGPLDEGFQAIGRARRVQREPAS